MDFRITSDFKVQQISLAFRIPFTSKVIRTSFQTYRDPNSWCVGIGSQCEDGRHVQFFDYDGKDIKQVIGDILFLQEYFSLPHAYLFQLDRDDSFHVIIPSKLSFSETYRILKNSNSDWGHQESAKKVRGHEWVLRVGPKGSRSRPRFIGYLKSKHDVHEISTAHKKFIENTYQNVPKLSFMVEDDCLMIPKVNYNTGSRVSGSIPKEFVEPSKEVLNGIEE